MLLAALHSQWPSSRQPILWLSQRHLLLEESHPVVHAVDTYSRSAWRAITGLLRSWSPLLLCLGSYSAPGFLGCAPGHSYTAWPQSLPFGTACLIRVGRLTLRCFSKLSCPIHTEFASRDSQSDSELPPFIPASGIEDQSLPWGICFYRAPRRGSYTHMATKLIGSHLPLHPSPSPLGLV